MIDVKYRRVHAQQSMLCNKAITRRNATHLSWGSEHAPRRSPRYPRCGGILGIDRSIGGNNVASRHGCVPRVERGGSKMKNRRGKRKRVRGRPPLLQRSIIQPALRVSLYTHISVFPAFFRFFFIFDQLLLRPITTGNFQP